MTIRRQYSLPNCTLILDGLSDGTNAVAHDSRPLMSSLFNAECHFVGCEQHLFGGRDFLTSLVTTVSNYAQEFLSGISHPLRSSPVDTLGSPNHLVSLVKGDRENVHQLAAILEPDTRQGTAIDAAPTKVNLSTVQLFDLVEAIDQFLADKRTLPDIMIPLQPISKSMAQPMMATQAVPVGLGLASLVVASLVGYALPNQQISAPKAPPAPVIAPTTPTTGTTAPVPVPSSPNPSPATTVPAPAVSPNPVNSSTPIVPTPATSTSPSPTSSTLPSRTGQLNDATQIGFLERQLQHKLNNNWQNRTQIKQAASFQVNVNQDGKIVSFEVGDKTNQTNLTPLPKLTTRDQNPNQAIGNFNVVFTPAGTIDVKPVAKLEGEKSLGKIIVDPKIQASLGEKLKTTLEKSLASEKPITTQDLNYRVAVTNTGEIADYEAEDATATSAESKTPLPKLAKFNPQAAISQEPLAQYKVVFQPDGKILVTPK
jgi:Domain of unknown function (DUF4335)